MANLATQLTALIADLRACQPGQHATVMEAIDRTLVKVRRMEWTFDAIVADAAEDEQAQARRAAPKPRLVWDRAAAGGGA